MKIKIENIDQIDRAAEIFINYTEGHNIFAFYGSMGAGKTSLIKAICNKLGSIDTVTSPSFTLVNEYRTDKDDLIYHFDFFRIETQEEVFDFGFEEYLMSGKKCFMEWPEKVESLLPPETLRVDIRVKPDLTRIVLLKP
ncbi:MAG: tRNA (adenosine(37)-N6)-threonylcarbamoyltransferase complex ATPase subunit type 1 TsaE [Bacteroidales bacterium]|nr:tRNA (adenosine(37)-N6)-threonylcarbamoyltransferase complex ATPase subunit type 1 TsaE [Bacteroidales bacterium]